MIDFNLVKEYLKVDTTDDDVLISLCIEQAQSYLGDSIDNFEKMIEKEKFKNKCKIPMLLLIEEMYENRRATVERNEKTSYILRSLMIQLKYCYDVE